MVFTSPRPMREKTVCNSCAGGKKVKGKSQTVLKTVFLVNKANTGRIKIMFQQRGFTLPAVFSSFLQPHQKRRGSVPFSCPKRQKVSTK